MNNQGLYKRNIFYEHSHLKAAAYKQKSQVLVSLGLIDKVVLLLYYCYLLDLDATPY